VDQTADFTENQTDISIIISINATNSKLT